MLMSVKLSAISFNLTETQCIWVRFYETGCLLICFLCFFLFFSDDREIHDEERLKEYKEMQMMEKFRQEQEILHTQV